MEELKKQVEELTEKVDLIMVQLEESGKYRREYENVEVFDQMVQMRSGLTLRRTPTNPTNIPTGQVYSDNGTLKIK